MKLAVASSLSLDGCAGRGPIQAKLEADAAEMCLAWDDIKDLTLSAFAVMLLTHRNARRVTP